MVLWRKNLKMVSVETILNEQHELANFPELCRLCGNLKESVVPIYDESQPYSYHDVITAHIRDIHVSKTDVLPLKLCVDCLTSVISWHEFHNTCLQVDEKLRAVVEKFLIVKPVDSELDQKVTNIEVIEVDVDGENYDDFYNDSEDHKESMLLDEAVNNFDDFTATENAETKQTDRENAVVQSTEENIEIIVEEGIDSTYDNSDVSNIITTYSDRLSNDDKSQADQFLVDVSELKGAQCETNECDDTVIRVDLGGLRYSQLEGFVLEADSPLYYCASCFKGYPTKEELLKHIGAQHSLSLCRSELYECDMCSRLFGDNEHRNRHRANVHRVEVPLPEDLKVVRIDMYRAAAVSEELPNDEKSYWCKLCNQNFSTVGKLKMHNMRKHGMVYENARRCSICSMISLNKRALSMHMKAVHANSSEVGKIAMTDEYLKFLSKRVVYEGQTRYFQCDQCSYRCLTLHNFARHGGRHMVTAPTCAHCDKTFNSKSQLRRHISLVHLRIKRFQCPMCGKMFGERKHMQEHMNLHRDSCSYICEVCGKQYKQRQTLTAHKQKHRGKKSYQCEFCDKAFTFRAKLLNHMKRHTGKNLSVCDICDKTFTSSTHLRVHMTKHSDVKPFTCDVCQKRVKTSRSLKRHMITFHSSTTTNVER